MYIGQQICQNYISSSNARVIRFAKIIYLNQTLASVSSQLLLSTLYYGLVNGKRNQEDPVKCANTHVIITQILD